MKLLIVVLLGFAVRSTWAQGTVVFQNGKLTFEPEADRYVYASALGDPDGRLVGTNYCAGLWYVQGKGNHAQLANGTGGVQALNVNATSPSLFNFRSPTTSEIDKGTWLPIGVNSFVLAGVAPGQSATLQVRVWDWATYGRSEAGYLTAYAAADGFGYSAPFDYTVPQAGSPPWLYYMNNLRAFVAPEPSTVALGALCATFTLLLWRRPRSRV